MSSTLTKSHLRFIFKPDDFPIDPTEISGLLIPDRGELTCACGEPIEVIDHKVLGTYTFRHGEHEEMVRNAFVIRNPWLFKVKDWLEGIHAAGGDA